jgi:protein-L-isoaspartate O-methyltransferase
MKKNGELMANNPVDEKLNMKRINIFWNVVDRLSTKSNFIEGFYDKTVGREYRNEINSFELAKSKKILHIGCGTYPITALILSELNGVKIVTIDHDAKSVETAHKIITNKKLEDKIQAKVGDGINYPLDGFDTIIISGCSFPKIKVVRHVLKNSNKKSRIIIREAYYKDKLMEMVKSINNVELIKKIDNNAFVMSKWESFYIVKN